MHFDKGVPWCQTTKNNLKPILSPSWFHRPEAGRKRPMRDIAARSATVWPWTWKHFCSLCRLRSLLHGSAFCVSAKVSLSKNFIKHFKMPLTLTAWFLCCGMVSVIVVWNSVSAILSLNLRWTLPPTRTISRTSASVFGNGTIPTTIKTVWIWCWPSTAFPSSRLNWRTNWQVRLSTMPRCSGWTPVTHGKTVSNWIAASLLSLP